MAKYKVLHYKSECIGCGACAAICPEFWEMDDEGISKLRNSISVDDHFELEITSESIKAMNQEAADACPAQVIKIHAVK
jgi:ferredoxin